MSAMDALKEKTRSLTVLYAEDDPASRQQVGEMLGLLFASVAVAADGQEAWEMFCNGTYDLVITDIQMPKMNGITLSEHIKRADDTQKVIIISAYDSGEYLLCAIRAGVDNFILKPVEMEQLMGVLDKVAGAIHNGKAAEFLSAGA